MGPGQGNIRKGKEGTRWLKKLIVKTVVVLKSWLKVSFHIKSTVSFFPFTILAFFTLWKPLVPLLHIYYWNKLSAVQTHHYWLQPEFRKRINVAMDPLPRIYLHTIAFGLLYQRSDVREIDGESGKGVSIHRALGARQRQSLNFSRENSSLKMSAECLSSWKSRLMWWVSSFWSFGVCG